MSTIVRIIIIVYNNTPRSPENSFSDRVVAMQLQMRRLIARNGDEWIAFEQMALMKSIKKC